MSRSMLAATAAAVVLLASIPMLLSQGLVNAAIQMLIAALFASAYNVLCGQAGMLSFGHAAYFGAGAFATVHAMNALGGTGLLPTPCCRSRARPEGSSSEPSPAGSPRSEVAPTSR